MLAKAHLKMDPEQEKGGGWKPAYSIEVPHRTCILGGLCQTALQVSFLLHRQMGNRLCWVVKAGHQMLVLLVPIDLILLG